MNQNPHFPISERFEDVYFSRENGMEESAHVFIRGGNVRELLRDNRDLVFCETGFGTGLNFLMLIQALEEQRKIAKNGQGIDYITFEKYPLCTKEIGDIHDFWAKSFPKSLTKLLEIYPKCTHGWQQIQYNSYVRILFIFDDVNTALPELDATVDCWFLDGFKPSTNPEMWSDVLYENMARLSKPETRFTTFTSAGHVRRGLERCGFDVVKIPGYGKKREMMVGQFRNSCHIDGVIGGKVDV